MFRVSTALFDGLKGEKFECKDFSNLVLDKRLLSIFY